MSQIYRNPHSVLVWLGEEYQHSSTTLLTMRSVIRLWDEEIRHRDRYSDLAAIDGGGEIRVEFGGLSRAHETLHRGLMLLSKRTYWTRIWIVQEITVARATKLFCGNEFARWSDFVMACNFRSERLLFEQWANRLWAPEPWEDKQRTEDLLSLRQQVSKSTMYGLFRSNDRWPRYKESFATLSSRYKTSGCEDSRKF